MKHYCSIFRKEMIWTMKNDTIQGILLNVVLWDSLVFSIVGRVVCSYSSTHSFKTTNQYYFVMPDTYIFQNKSQFTLILLILDLGSICYTDLWVTQVTFREHNNQNKHSNSILWTVKRYFFVCTTSALVFTPIFSDFKCTLHFHSLKAMK